MMRKPISSPVMAWRTKPYFFDFSFYSSISHSQVILLRTLITLCSTLNPLPKQRWITMQLYYYDDITVSHSHFIIIITFKASWLPTQVLWRVNQRFHPSRRFYLCLQPLCGGNGKVETVVLLFVVWDAALSLDVYESACDGRYPTGKLQGSAKYCRMPVHLWEGYEVILYGNPIPSWRNPTRISPQHFLQWKAEGTRRRASFGWRNGKCDSSNHPIKSYSYRRTTILFSLFFSSSF